MNYGEIKQNLISLGFAEESDYEEFEELGYTYDAINRSISSINTIFPAKVYYEFEVDNSEDGRMEINLPSIDKDFLCFCDTPVLVARNEKENNTYKEVTLYKKFSDYEIEEEDTIIIDAPSIHGNTNDSKLTWTFRVFYEKKPTTIDKDTADSFVTELPLKCHHLIPLLAAYYLWLDDEPTKAAQYYNLYEQERNNILQKDNRPRARVELPKEGVI